MTGKVIATITYSIEDVVGKQAKIVLYTHFADVLPDGTYVHNPNWDAGVGSAYYTNLLEYFQEVGKRIDAAILGRVTGMTISVAHPVPEVKAIAGAAADAQEGLRLNFDNPDGQITLWTFDHTLIDPELSVGIAAMNAIAALGSFLALLGNSTEAWVPGYGQVSNGRGERLRYPVQGKRIWKDRFKP